MAQKVRQGGKPENAYLTGVTTGKFQQTVKVEPVVPYENKMEEAHIYKREKYLSLTKELRDAGYKGIVVLIDAAGSVSVEVLLLYR